MELMGPPPTREQLEDYLASRHNDPEALLAVGLILEDLSFLRRALEADPDNPHVLFSLATSRQASAVERRAWRDRLLALQPHNAMASPIWVATKPFRSDWASDAGTGRKMSYRQSTTLTGTAFMTSRWRW